MANVQFLVDSHVIISQGVSLRPRASHNKFYKKVFFSYVLLFFIQKKGSFYFFNKKNIFLTRHEETEKAIWHLLQFTVLYCDPDKKG